MWTPFYVITRRSYKVQKQYGFGPPCIMDAPKCLASRSVQHTAIPSNWKWQPIIIVGGPKITAWHYCTAVITGREFPRQLSFAENISISPRILFSATGLLRLETSCNFLAKLSVYKNRGAITVKRLRGEFNSRLLLQVRTWVGMVIAM